MSATATGLRDPRLRRGVSAFAWTRAFLIAWLVGMIVILPVFLLEALNGFNRSSSGLIFVVIPLLLIEGIVGVAGRVRQSTEKAAGYATVLSPGGQLDLLDPHSGAVLWRVGDPPLQGVGLLGTLRGEQALPARDSSRGEPAFPPKRASSWAFQILPFVLFLVVAIVVLSTTHSKVNVWTFALFYLCFAAFGGFVLLLVFVQTRLGMGRRIRALSALRPEAMIFTSTSTRAVSSALAALGVVRSRSGRFPVVVTDSAIEFWDLTGDAPWLSIPWTEVTRVDADSAPIGNNSFRAVTLALVHGDRPVSVTLPMYGRQGVFSASPSWANQVFDEIQFHLAKR